MVKTNFCPELLGVTMTIIVVHGAIAYGSSWYQSSWSEDGFLTGSC